jgi:hypothetical protein
MLSHPFYDEAVKWTGHGVGLETVSEIGATGLGGTHFMGM